MWSLLYVRWQLCVEKALPILCKWTFRRHMVKVTWLTPVLFSNVLCPVNQICCKIFNEYRLCSCPKLFYQEIFVWFCFMWSLLLVEIKYLAIWFEVQNVKCLCYFMSHVFTWAVVFYLILKLKFISNFSCVLIEPYLSI